MSILRVLHNQSRHLIEVDNTCPMSEAAKVVAEKLGISPDWPDLLLVNSSGDEIPGEVRAEVYHGHTVQLRTRETMTHTQALIVGKR